MNEAPVRGTVFRARRGPGEDQRRVDTARCGAGSRALALFATPTNGVYPDPAGADGSEVTFPLLGEQITVRLSDLLR